MRRGLFLLSGWEYNQRMARTTVKFSFDNGRGQKLAGLIDMPAEPPAAWGVFAPCFTCTKEAHAAFKICRALADRGVGVLRFNMTGLGDSEGDFAHTNFSTRVLDIIAACDALEEAYAAPSFLIGHSISGTAALSAAHSVPSLKLLATLGSPRDPLYTLDKFHKNKQIEIKGEMAELTIAGRKVMVHGSFGEDMKKHDIAAETSKWNRKLLVFQAPNDEIVSADNARTIFERASGDKELIWLSDACTHLLEKNDDDAAFIADTVLDRLTK